MHTESAGKNDLRTHNVNIYSLDCNYVCTRTDVCVRRQQEWKSISYQGLYCIICVIYCTICLQGNVAFKDWWCLQDYTISKELSDPPRTMKWDLFNLLFILCLRVVSSDLSGNLPLSGRLFKEERLIPSLIHVLSFRLWHFFTFLLIISYHSSSPPSSPFLFVDGQIW